MAEGTTAFTKDDFFSLLTRSGLLNERLLEAQKLQFQGAEDSPKTILAQMISEHLLTPFQAKQLGDRRHRGFFLSEKYKILEFIGQGGMSRVLLCEHLLLQRLVAVKILNKALDKFPGSAERFLREARASASMDHPNIARIFDVDRTNLGPCIVMEFVDGTNLHDLVMKRGLLPISRVAHYISQAATGLQQAHLAGLVHRDVKPANLVLDRTGTIKLLDLGLARFFDPTRSDGLTQQIDASCIIGTADYIAPEQVMASSSVDIRADIYSLGYTMYFMLTRNLPAGTGPAMRKLVWHQTLEPEPVRSLRTEVPQEMADVLERMIKKNPSERFQTPAEIVVALKPWTKQPIDPPDSVEMPRTRATTYRLGLCPPPDESKFSTSKPAVAAQSNSGRQISDQGSSTVEHKSTANTATKSQAGSKSTIGYSDPTGTKVFTTDSSVTSTSKTAEIMSFATETDKTSASSFGRKLAESTILARRFTRRHWLSFSGMLLTFGIGVLVAGWWLGNSLRSTSKNSIATVPTTHEGSEPAPPSELTPTDPAPNPERLPSIPLTGTVLRAGGSTFIRTIMEHWCRVYETQTGIKIEYSAVGSTKGVDGLMSHFLDFSCTDAYLSDDQLAEAGGNIVHIPLVMGAVVPTYNVPSETDEQMAIRFTGATLANIYLGKIKKWNDPTIVVSNPGQNLPDIDITVVYRKDGSGTTSIWTDFLSKSNSTWRKQIGASSKVKFPVGLAVEKNDGVADTVSRTVGAIGYVELGFALANSLAVGEVKNQSGAFIKPSVEGITAAAAASVQSIPGDLRYSLTDPPGSGSYPIVGTCWAIVHTSQSSDRGPEIVKFLKWATSDGQSHIANLPYGMLPAEFADKIANQLNRITTAK